MTEIQSMQKIFFSVATLILAAACLYGFFDQRKNINIPADDFIVDTLARNLTVPWAMAFIDDSTLIFTERNGKIRMLRNDRLVDKPALVVDNTDSTKKMGMLGLCLHPNFAQNKFIYVAHNYRNENRSLLKVERYRFANDSLVEPKIVIDNINASPNHTGCRLKFGPDGKLFITTGDADRPILAQDLKSLNGKILRVNDDGTVPADNPFVNNDTARKEIWTYGHRNTQGIDFQPTTNDLYNSEHGPTGGDEMNKIIKGMNYGWPVIHHRDAKENMRSPLAEFTPSIGPSELVFYKGNAFPFLKGDILLACLRGEAIMHFKVEKNQLVQQSNLFQHRYGRIRAIAISKEGYIYFSTSQNDPPEGKAMQDYDMICRMRPSGTVSRFTDTATIAATTIVKPAGKQSTTDIYISMCAGCHGNNLEGTDRAKSMRDGVWEFGAGKDGIAKSIRTGVIEKGMPAFEGALAEKEIKKLVEFIIKRSGNKK